MLLKVSDDKTTQTVKMISTGSGKERERITYQGPSGTNPQKVQSVSYAAGFIFHLGNPLQFTGYVNGYIESILLDNPVSSETYTFSMLKIPFNCGDSLTINHLAGSLAPVSKTVTYGTVTHIPGANEKCWITSNLGADHQATALNDATEPSAGWYWQFNRKQGYKHDGTTRTPNTIWVTSINENSDWTAANDPCTLELGNTWRIPTQTEWTNVDASGNWTNWNGPWNSPLKMHAAGFLGYNDGSLLGRGLEGDYWSSSQDDVSKSWYIVFNSIYSNIYNYYKPYGMSLRCLAD
jgi:hypothetical protein